MRKSTEEKRKGRSRNKRIKGINNYGEKQFAIIT